MNKEYSTQPGRRFPFGATFDSKGTNFSAWGRFATHVELLLFERSDSPTPFQAIELDPEVNRTFLRGMFMWWESLPVRSMGGASTVREIPGPQAFDSIKRKFFLIHGLLR